VLTINYYFNNYLKKKYFISFHTYKSNELVQEKCIIHLIIITKILLFYFFAEETAAQDPKAFCEGMGQQGSPSKSVKERTEQASTSNLQPNVVGRQIFVHHEIDLNETPDFDLNEIPEE